MISKLTDLIRENRRNQKEILRYSKELYWSNLFKDSTKNLTWLNTFSLNLGGWAAGYPFMYILSRVLTEFKPKNILELGLGESSKFISEYLKKSSTKIDHIILEHDLQWLNQFNNEYKLSSNSLVQICKLKNEIFKGNQIKLYDDVNEVYREKFELYIIDGPVGTDRFSRFDMVRIGECLNERDDFFFIIDDYDRAAERETTLLLIDLLNSKNIDFSYNLYGGLKQIMVIGTPRYKKLLTI